MIKLMIADDEAGIRRGLKQYIDWNAWDIVLAAEASDGAEAYRRALEVQPDILISDIRMPGKDGLELCRMLREALPALRIILLTGYDSTEYLRAALQSGVREYLLKPAGADKIISSVLRCKQEIMEERARREKNQSRDALLDESLPILQMHFISDLVNGRSERLDALRHRAKLFGIPLDGPWFQTLTMRIWALQAEDCRSRVEQDMAYWQLIQKLETACREEDAFFCEMEPDEYFILVNAGRRAEADRKIAQVAERLVVSIGHNDDRHVVIGTGAPAAEPLQIGESYLAALRAFRASAWDRGRQIFPLTLAGTEDWPDEARGAEKRALAALAAGRPCTDDMGALFCACREARTDFAEVRRSCAQLIALCRRMREQRGEDAGDLDSDLYRMEDFFYADELEEWVCTRLGELLERGDSGMPAHSPLVNKALSYLTEHYGEDITLQSLAKRLFISPNYLGRMFRQETGYKLSDWLNRCRVERAKELLMDPRARTAEVAGQVGFSSYKYFSVCFAKYAGCTLRDYRSEWTHRDKDGGTQSTGDA